MTDLEDNLTKVLNAPEIFLEPTDDLEKSLIRNSKILFDFMCDVELSHLSQPNALKELLTTGFDNEQVWQQLELQNNPLVRCIKKELKEIDRNNGIFKLNGKEVDNENPYQKEQVVAVQGDFDASFSSDDDQEDLEKADLEKSVIRTNTTEKMLLKKYKPSIVDDKFFRLREMEEFLEKQDKLEQLKQDGENKESDDDEIDLFEEMISEDEDHPVEDIKYEDFFDVPIQKPSKTSEPTKKDTGGIKEDINFEDYDHDNEDNENYDKPGEEDSSDSGQSNAENKKANLSKFEKTQNEIKKKINRLEEANIANKPWQLTGEATARVRPVNSLLEEHVAFDHLSVGAPVITQETTETLEDLIKQRIKDQAWDDVDRKQKPTNQPYEYKKAPELNQEKSKLSLAEVYEKEYLKEQEAKEEDKENEEHALIKTLMEKLFMKLDALSNFQFTPKPPKPELKIISNNPSLQMEEVTPITVAESMQMAPEEIYDKARGDVKGSSEKSVSDKKHERRQKKIKKKFAAKEKERKEKLKIKSGKVVKTSKKKVIDQLKKNSRNTIVNSKSGADKNIRASNEFFNRLQDEVRSSIKIKKTLPKMRTKKLKTTQALKL